MTVCVGALANYGNAVLCIADKALTYQNYGNSGTFQWDADVTKIIPVGKRLVALMSGAEESCTRLLYRLHNIKGFGDTHTGTLQAAESEYTKVSEELSTAMFLTPNLLTKEEYVAAISQPKINSHVKAIADSIQSYDMQCDILLCGFEASGDTVILHLRAPGICTNMLHTGFHAVGAGWERAVSQMLWSDYERKNSMARVFYDVFDAKANAEMTVGVGYEWDAKVIIKGVSSPFDVPKEQKELIEKAWAKYNRSPFKKRNPKEDLDPPPKNWKELLDEYFNSLVPSRRASQPNPQLTTADR
jgi:hypothetical protein